MKRRDAGFTLIEMMIAIAIVAFVIAAASTFFVMSVQQYKVQTKIIETNLEGILGLELLRRDMECLGFGLPWNNLSSYTEKSGNGSSLNDSPPNPPRSVVSIDLATFTVNNSDYLVIKSASVGMDNAAGKWTTLRNLGGVGVTRSWVPTSENLAAGDYVIVLSVGSADSDRRSVVSSGSTFAVATGSFPVDNRKTNIVYGIGNSIPVRPFNRAEYYIADALSNPSITVPQRCAPNTGVLVKAVVAHDAAGNTTNLLPLLDCAADMQIVYGLDTDGDGAVNNWATDISSGMTAADIRSQLVEVRVYILAQVGMRDNGYRNPADNVYVGATDVGGGRWFDISGYRNYRWKLYQIVTKTRNLAQ